MAALLVVALGLGACGRNTPDGQANDPPTPLVLTRSIGGQPGSLDPSGPKTPSHTTFSVTLYEGLTASTPDGAVIPATATSWRIEEGGRQYIFQLRRDARWSNGDPVTAAHFVSGFRRALDPKTVSGAAELLRAIENAPAILHGDMPPDRLGVRAVDDYTLEIRLSHAVPYFPDILTNTVASPVHPSSLAASGGFSAPGKTVSNGPYALASFAPGASLLLTRNPHYWDSAAVAFDEVRYEFVPDENAEFTRHEFRPAFVLMPYFGYLRRNPDDLPDTDFSGFDFFHLNTDPRADEGNAASRRSRSPWTGALLPSRWRARGPGPAYSAGAGRRVELRACVLRLARRQGS
jgi:ABC-type oligopeptide transport system substrate-binding subunit